MKKCSDCGKRRGWIPYLIPLFGPTFLCLRCWVRAIREDRKNRKEFETNQAKQ